MTDPANLMIALIDEVQRTRGRIRSISETFADPDGPVGLEMTVLASVARAPHRPTVPQIGRSLGYPRQWDPLESTCRHASLSIL